MTAPVDIVPVVPAVLAREELAGGVVPPVYAYLATLSAGSRRTMAAALRAVVGVLWGDAPGRPEAKAFPWTRLDYARLQWLRTELAARYAPATANKLLASVRGVLREAFRLGVLDAASWERARLVGTVKGSRPPAGRALAPAEVAALFGACDLATARGWRDAALLALLYGCGLRCGEARGVARADVDLSGGVVVVSGKGNKVRRAPLPPAARAALAGWLAVRPPGDGPVLTAVLRGYRGPARPLSPKGVVYVLARLVAAAGVRGFTPHDLRRTFATTHLDAGADLAIVQRLLGHASIATTLRYDRRGEAAAARAALALPVPFNGGKTDG